MTRIMVVDDYPVTLRVLKAQLQKQGHQVITAGSGREALACLQHQSIELAILDIAMPEMDGIELLGVLRSDARFGQRPVIMLTASTLDQHRLAAKQAGATAFLTKPVSSWELVETVDKCMEAVAQRGEDGSR